MKDPILPNFRIIRLENPTFTLNLTLPFWIKMDLKVETFKNKTIKPVEWK